MSKPETIAFIPARGGSKRVPGKNVKPFHGQPLAWWTIDLAKRSRLFSQIIVSTDDPSLVDLACAEGCTVLERPAHLANDTATVVEVIRQVGETLGLTDETRIAVLLVTGPLRVMSDLIEGFRLFEEHGGKRTVLAVSLNPTPPALLWEMGENGALRSLAAAQDQSYTRKQGHASTYYSNDILTLDTLGAFKVPGRSLFGMDPLALVVPPERSMPIDEPYQFKLAELLFPPTDERAETAR
jgi:N-acylneuraminate cytidylyltransferase